MLRDDGRRNERLRDRVATYGWLRPVTAEGIGTALLVASVVGSGIMGQRLAPGQLGLILLANSLATGAMLVALIFTIGPISGAHFNPAVTIIASLEDGFNRSRILPYVVAQVIGGIIGTIAAHFMFDMPLLSFAEKPRQGASQLFSEVVATFGLLLVILRTGPRPSVVPITVAAYIVAAYWFTSSTSFANPAVTIARALTSSFSGIRIIDAPGFIAAQMIGAFLALLVHRFLSPSGGTK